MIEAVKSKEVSNHRLPTNRYRQPQLLYQLILWNTSVFQAVQEPYWQAVLLPLRPFPIGMLFTSERITVNRLIPPDEQPDWLHKELQQPPTVLKPIVNGSVIGRSEGIWHFNRCVVSAVTSLYRCIWMPVIWNLTPTISPLPMPVYILGKVILPSMERSVESEELSYAEVS